MCKSHHSVSLGTDPPLANTIQQFFSVPQTLKNLAIPPRSTKSPDNSNVLHMFNNNNTYNDFQQLTSKWFNRTKMSQN